jgi:hypothetical protein
MKGIMDNKGVLELRQEKEETPGNVYSGLI